MIKTYKFFGENPLEFEDTKTVKELLEYAFEEFGYYEPFGMDKVTVFQAYHPSGNYGWFTCDTTRKCSDEIKNRNELCFAYYIPDFLYFAEGGWGHHMKELGGHPEFSNPVSIKLRFEDFNHTVVFEGTHSFREVLNLLKRVGYIDESIERIIIHVCAYPNSYYTQYLDCHNSILDAPMVEFDKALPIDGIMLGGADYA